MLYPLIYFQSQDFKNLCAVFPGVRGGREGFGLAAPVVADGKNANRFGRSPSLGTVRMPQRRGESTPIFKKSENFFRELPESRFFYGGKPRGAHG